MSVYYNDSEPFVCAWLRNLIAAKLLPAGDVDERPIQEVSPDDVRRYSQAHFFAGIGGWPYALQLASWGDRAVWTGSCPCQPLSGAGQRKGHADQRHLWPAFYRLIAECRPPVVFGEQVAKKLGREWLAGVRADLESCGYAVGAADMPAAGVGAPHQRQRLWWVADADRYGTLGNGRDHRDQERSHVVAGTDTASDDARDVADAPSARGRGIDASPEGGNGGRPRQTGSGGAVQDAPHDAAIGTGVRRHVPADWWFTEPDVGRVAYGIPDVVGRLRGFGNAIVPQVAAAFIEAYLECAP